MTLIEAAQKALEALGYALPFDGANGEIRGAITDLRTAIETTKKQDGWVLREVLFDEGEPIAHREPEKQEPVAWADEIIDDLNALYNSEMITENDSGDALIRLDAAICAVEEAEQRHTTPPAAQRQWVGLTDEQKQKFLGGDAYGPTLHDINAIEAALKENNT